MWIICSYILRSINKLVMHSWLELNWILQMRTWRKRSGVSIPFHFVWYIAFVLLQNCFFLYIWKHKGRWGNLHGAWFHLVPQYCQWHFAGRQQRQWRRNIQARRNIPVRGVSTRSIRAWESCSGFSSGPLDLYILAAVVGSKLSKLELWHGATCNETPVRFCCGHVFFCAS